MNNSIFISRCETILTTMRASSSQSATTKQIAQWLNIEEHTAAQVIAKACKYNLLQKKGSASKTCYVFSTNCHNSLEQRINSSNDVIASVSYVVDWFINKASRRSVQKVTSVNGKEFVRVQSNEELDTVSKQAIDNILTVIKQNGEMKTEIELLKEEIERLKPYEEYYKKVTAVKV